MHQVWTAMVKFLHNQCQKGRCIDLPTAGKFLKVDGEGDNYCFMPHLDLVGSGVFSFPENDFNVSPFSKAAGRFRNATTLSLTSICAGVNSDRERVAGLIKQVFVKFVSTILSTNISLDRTGPHGETCPIEPRSRITCFIP